MKLRLKRHVMFKRSNLLTLLVVITCCVPMTGFTRSPSVEDVVEIELNEKNPAKNAPGYNFEQPESAKRVPANIVTNHKREPASQVFVPFLILLAIPFGIWMLVSKQKKIARELEAAYKAEEHLKEASKDDDDFTMPKAS